MAEAMRRVGVLDEDAMMQQMAEEKALRLGPEPEQIELSAPVEEPSP